MKLLKIEKIWLITAILLVVIYCMPGLPAYGSVRGSLIHNAILFPLIWGLNYYFFFKVNKIYKLKDQKDIPESVKQKPETTYTTQ